MSYTIVPFCFLFICVYFLLFWSVFLIEAKNYKNAQERGTEMHHIRVPHLEMYIFVNKIEIMLREGLFFFRMHRFSQKCVFWTKSNPRKYCYLFWNHGIQKFPSNLTKKFLLCKIWIFERFVLLNLSLWAKPSFGKKIKN